MQRVAQMQAKQPKMQKFQNCYEDEILKRLRDYKKIQNFNVIVLEAVKKVLTFVSQEPMS